MECSSNWEYKTLIDELSQGKEQAQQLKDHWSSTSSEVPALFLHRIISSFEKSLLILNCNGSASQSQDSPPLVVSGPIESSSMSVDNNSPQSENLNASLKDQKKLRPSASKKLSVDNNSPQSENLNASLKDQKKLRPSASKKRKTLPTWTEQVRVNSEHGLEGPSDDSYSWRKYGQKDILGAKFPRSYYRCTYRHVQNCWSTKYVQRSDDDPTVFDITYKGAHTCYQSTTNNSVAAPVSPEKQEMKPTRNHNSHQLQQPNEVLINFRANLRVNTGEPDDNNTNNSFAFPSTFTFTEGDDQLYHTSNPADEAFLGTYSPAFVSPATPESNYFSMSNGYMNSLGGTGTSNWKHYESDLTDIISANASVTNSPSAPIDIPIDPVDLDPNFPFNMSVLFA